MLKRYTASLHTTIVNAYQLNLRTWGTGANAGQADVLETFSIYGIELIISASPASQELSRILSQFPIDTITSTELPAPYQPAEMSTSICGCLM